MKEENVKAEASEQTMATKTSSIVFALQYDQIFRGKSA